MVAAALVAFRTPVYRAVSRTYREAAPTTPDDDAEEVMAEAATAEHTLG